MFTPQELWEAAREAVQRGQFHDDRSDGLVNVSGFDEGELEGELADHVSLLAGATVEGPETIRWPDGSWYKPERTHLGSCSTP